MQFNNSFQFKSVDCKSIYLFVCLFLWPQAELHIANCWEWSSTVTIQKHQTLKLEKVWVQ